MLWGNGAYDRRYLGIGTDEFKRVTRTAVTLTATGRAFGQKMVIEKGIAAGETVVTDGQLRLFPGAKVQAADAGKPESGQ